MNTIIEQRKQNWIDFFDIKSPVSRILLTYCDENMPPCPLLWWENIKEREEWAYGKYMVQMDRLDKIHDNTIPFLSMLTGTEIFAEAFGCPVHKPIDNNPFARPLIRDVSEWYKIKMPRWEDTNLTKLFDMADHLKARAGKEALLSLPDIQSPIDIAAIIWEKSDFYASMFDEEPAILELTAMIREFMFSFLDEWFRRYGSDFIAHHPDYYMPYGITLSEDEIGIINSDMYRTYFHQELCDFSARYGAIGIHSCADSQHQWGNLKEIPNLKLLNLNRPDDLTLESFDFFRDCTALYPSVPVDSSSLKDHGKIHIASMFSFETEKEAAAFADQYNEETARIKESMQQ